MRTRSLRLRSAGYILEGDGAFHFLACKDTLVLEADGNLDVGRHGQIGVGNPTS